MVLLFLFGGLSKPKKLRQIFSLALGCCYYLLMTKNSVKNFIDMGMIELTFLDIEYVPEETQKASQVRRELRNFDRSLLTDSSQYSYKDNTGSIIECSMVQLGNDCYVVEESIDVVKQLMGKG